MPQIEASTLRVNWTMCEGDPVQWCNLVLLDVNSIIEDEGVCIIWHGGPQPRVVRAGRGQRRARKVTPTLSRSTGACGRSA